MIKVGTGIGCGIVCHGEVYRGATGSAGDVGHICVDQEGPRCHCGNLGCVEAMAAGPAITRMAVRGGARRARAPRWPNACAPRAASTPIDVGQASRAGDAAANAIVQRAGSLIGQMLASVVNFFNPSHVFIGGGITRIGPLFLAAVRQSVYQRSLALSTRHLEIQYTPLGAQAGLIGAGVLAMQETLQGAGGGAMSTTSASASASPSRSTQVVKAFGPVQVLHGVSFALAPGRVYGLLGENGAGKSTLMKILAGYEPPTGGKLRVNGEPRAASRARAMPRRWASC